MAERATPGGAPRSLAAEAASLEGLRLTASLGRCCRPFLDVAGADAG